MPVDITRARDDRPVLVVDDDAAVREVLRSLLESEFGIRALLAADGQEALARLGDEQPVLILTDVRMPNLDGTGFVRALRSCPATRRIPVLVVAATPAPRNEAMLAGADDYLDKPFDVDRMVAKIRHYLGPTVVTPAA